MVKGWKRKFARRITDLERKVQGQQKVNLSSRPLSDVIQDVMHEEPDVQDH